VQQGVGSSGETLTQLLCLVNVLRAEDGQLLHGQEGSAGRRAGEVVEARAALGGTPERGPQALTVFTMLREHTGREGVTTYLPAMAVSTRYRNSTRIPVVSLR